MKPTILFLFNSSDYAVQPWLDDGGFNVVSVDYDDTDHSGAHREPTEGHTVLNIDLSQYGVLTVQSELIYRGMAQPSLVVSFAPCTDLAVSGAAHFKKKLEADPLCQRKATKMAQLASEFDCAYMVENPVSVLATMWRKPDMYFHPWQFSYLFESNGIQAEHPEFPDVIPDYDWYNKKTCLWTGNGFVLPRKDWVQGPSTVNPGHAQLGGKSARTKYIRSLTPRGFAQAVYDANRDVILSQWGTQTDKPMLRLLSAQSEQFEWSW